MWQTGCRGQASGAASRWLRAWDEIRLLTMKSGRGQPHSKTFGGRTRCGSVFVPVMRWGQHALTGASPTALGDVMLLPGQGAGLAQARTTPFLCPRRNAGLAVCLGQVLALAPLPRRRCKSGSPPQLGRGARVLRLDIAPPALLAAAKIPDPVAAPAASQATLATCARPGVPRALATPPTLKNTGRFHTECCPTLPRPPLMGNCCQLSDHQGGASGRCHHD